MKLKSLFPLVCVLFTGAVLHAQISDSVNKHYYSDQPNYTKGALAQNGFRLKKKEVIYTNTALFMNNFQFGLSDFFSLGGTFMLIPISGENGSGAVPFVMINAKAGYTFNKYHHLSISTNLAPFDPFTITPTLAYTFGKPRLYVGLVGMIENVFNERNYLLLQSGFGIGKHIVIASEFILLSGRASLVKEGSVYYSSMYDDDSFRFLSIMGKITPGKKNRFTLNVGYFLYDGDPLLNIGFSLRLNKRKAVK